MATLKPATLNTATSVSALQTQMKADLKGRVGKTDVKFVAAKNCKIGSKTAALFIVTDTPNAFETIIKTRFPTAVRAKGTCDVLAGTEKGTFQVTVKTATGGINMAAVADLIRPAIGSKQAVLVGYGRTPRPLDNAPVKSGVSDLDKTEYIRDAVEVVIASMTPDNKIGSIYFDGEGRIRTTHATGAKSSVHKDQETVQFNINKKAAETAFALAKPKKAAEKDKDKRKKYWAEWIKSELGGATPNNLPGWATLVAGKDTAYDLGGGGAPKGMQLIEIFKGINGDVEGWHPSRGVAAKFVTDKQTISVLKAAIAHIDGQGLTDPNVRNIAFYEFVQSRLPKFAPYMREPSTIKVKVNPKKKKK